MEVLLQRLQTLERKTKKLERELEAMEGTVVRLRDTIDKIEKPKKETDEISAGWFWQ